MTDVQSLLRALDQEIQEAETLARRFPVRAALYLFDHVLALYLWGAIEVADAMLLLARERRVGRTPSLDRYLFEVLVDVAFLVTRPSEEWEQLAARSLAWNVLEHARHYRLVKEAHRPGNLRAPPQPPEAPDEAIERLAELVEQAGGSPKPLREAYEDLKAARSQPTHWSGKHAGGSGGRIELVSHSTNPPAWWGQYADQLYKLFSAAHHATPVWPYVGTKGSERLREAGKPVQLPGTLRATEEETAGVLTRPLTLLTHLRELVMSTGWS